MLMPLDQNGCTFDAEIYHNSIRKNVRFVWVSHDFKQNGPLFNSISESKNLMCFKSKLTRMQKISPSHVYMSVIIDMAGQCNCIQ